MTLDRGDELDVALPTSLSGLMALVVEDEWIVAHDFKSILESVGMYVVGTVGTAADAERLSSLHELHLAVVDIELQREMSYELIEWLCDRGISVVIVSGHDLPDRLARKVAAVMTKPIRAADLLATVRRLAARHATV